MLDLRQLCCFIGSVTLSSFLFAGCTSGVSVGTIRLLESEPHAEQSTQKATVDSDRALSAKKQGGTPENCPVTKPVNPPFVPPSPYPERAPSPHLFWYGSDGLWTAIPKDGKWSSLPHSAKGYTQKLFWWRDGYSWKNEPRPKLVVSGKRLDGTTMYFEESDATNAYAPDIQSAMLVGVLIPASGCWEIAGQYGDETLRFVVWVAPE